MNRKKNMSAFGLLAVSQFALVLVAVLLLWGLEVQLSEARFGVMLAVVVGVALTLVTFFSFAFIYRFGGRFAQSLVNDISKVAGLFRGCSLWHLALVSVLAGVGEELLFRGFLQVWLAQHLSIAAAILVASLIFGVFHYLSHAYFICATLMSIVFGVTYYFTGSMLMVVVWHGLYDFLALLVIVKFPHMVGISEKLNVVGGINK